jgi:hypothetical protein
MHCESLLKVIVCIFLADFPIDNIRVSGGVKHSEEVLKRNLSFIVLVQLLESLKSQIMPISRELPNEGS